MAQNATQSHLIRQIGLGSGIAVVVGSTIGSGIFKSPAGIAEKVPSAWPMLLVWVIGGVIALCGALTLAEVGGAFPYSGGIYVYCREAFGRMTGFLFGWAQLLLLRPASIGALAIAFGNYAMRLFGVPDSAPGFNEGSAMLAVGAVVVVSVANLLGLRFGVLLQNLTTIGKSLGILVLVVLALFIALPHAGSHFSAAMPPGGIDWSKFGLALVSVLWAYDGWADGAYVSGEILDPRRNVPRAIVLGTAFVIVVYLLANIGYLAVFSISEIAASKTLAADAMAKLVGLGGITFIVGTVMVSTFGTLNGTLITSPRIFFALAEDRLFFAPLARVHPKYKTPHVAVLLCAALGILYVVLATVFAKSDAFGALTDAFVIAALPFYALAVGSTFVFRARSKGLPAPVEDDSLVDPLTPGHLETHPHAYNPPVKTPLFPLTPVVFILACGYLLLNSLLDEKARVFTLVTLGVLAAGIPVYYATFGRPLRSE